MNKITGGFEYEYGGFITKETQGIIIESKKDPSKKLRVDVEQGEIISDGRMIDFEDVFLNDQNQLLRLRFNPKVSSFKLVVEEQKIHTIGSKYPIFFRNGNIKYREMSISGLISSEADPEQMFMSFNEEEDIFLKERKYKLAVEEWLTNGQVKLLRTPAEGNHWVRLMNVSMSPMDQLGRRLHSFNATAYEVEAPNWYRELISSTNVTDEGAAADD